MGFIVGCMMGNVLGLRVGTALGCDVMGEELGFIVWDKFDLRAGDANNNSCNKLKIGVQNILN